MRQKFNDIVWKSLSDNTKSVYMTKANTRKKIANEKGLKYLKNDEGYKNFAIIKVKINKIIFLHLNHNGNKRALFKYERKNKYFWLVP